MEITEWKEWVATREHRSHTSEQFSSSDFTSRSLQNRGSQSAFLNEQQQCPVGAYLKCKFKPPDIWDGACHLSAQALQVILTSAQGSKACPHLIGLSCSSQNDNGRHCGGHRRSTNLPPALKECAGWCRGRPGIVPVIRAHRSQCIATS